MKKFGHYEVTSELGRGGMGVVYKGFEPSLNRRVAIKCLGEHLLNDDDLIERFTREAKATAALNHPNVIQIYYIGKEDRQPFFAMEYIEGESLDDILQGGNALSVNHAKNILSQACKGMSAAHDIELVHRDIKPANIMITKDGTLKIVDFGIARTREYGDKLTNTGEFVGTPGYLSPEVCIGKEVDQRSDIFSLGIVFYEMLAGKVPFENDSPLGLMLEVVQADIPDIRALNKKVDRKTSFILNKMIAKSPEERYQSCDEILRDLGKVSDKQPINVLKSSAVVVNYEASNKSKISEQITLPSGAVISSDNTAPGQKSKKSWLLAATLFAVAGAASVGYYQGYLPFPSQNNTQTVAMVDEDLMASAIGNADSEVKTTDVLASKNEIEDISNDLVEEDNLAVGEDNLELKANIGNSLAGDTQQDVAQVDDSEKIEFPEEETYEEPLKIAQSGFQIDIVAADAGKVENIEEKNNTQSSAPSLASAKQLEPVKTSATNVSVDDLKVTESKISNTNLDDLVQVAHVASSDKSAIAEIKSKNSTYQKETMESVVKEVIQKSVKRVKAIQLDKGVVVIAFGDPAVANPIEKIIETQLKQQGVKVMNEQFISGMKQLLENGLDLAEMKSLIEKSGGQAMVIANVNYVGSQELQYAGRSTELVNAQVDIDTYDIKTGDSIGSGFGSQINYTSLNATEQASDVVMQYTDELAVNLKDKI